jgi:hypothetical protein
MEERMRYDRQIDWNRGGRYDSGDDYGYGPYGYGGVGRGMRIGYDRGYGASETRRAYDSHYKSRLQTDYGDPFGDRASGTPIRMIRGPYQTSYDRDYGWSRAHGPDSMYDRDHVRGTDYGRRPGAGMDRGAYGWRPRYDGGW